MGRPAKPYAVLVTENKSHRTKKELETRKQAEEALLTKTEFKEKKEVKQDTFAHKEFLRIRKLFKVLDKNDGLFENVVNRYCMLYAECKQFEEKRETFYKSIEALEQEYEADMETDEPEIKTIDYLKMRTTLQGQVVALDKQIMNKRKMMLDIEKENLMTIAAALRTIPKTPAEEEDPNADMFD